MSRVVRRPWIVLLGVLVALTYGAATPGERFEGPFTAEPVRAPECTSPVGFCTHGLLYDEDSGHLVATYDFTMLTQTPTGNGTEATFTGESIITKVHGASGQLFGEDEGVITLNAVGPSPFVTRVHIVAGTDSYEGASGLITATGELDLITGQTAGHYAGEVMRGN